MYNENQTESRPYLIKIQLTILWTISINIVTDIMRERIGIAIAES